jgi:hypothetical protein
MTMRETVEIIKESPLWNMLTTGEKLDALLDAVENIDGAKTSRNEQIDVTDIIGEIFKGYSA